MNKADKDLEKLLDGTGVKPHNPLDDKFDNPLGQLDDLFESFARIFTPYTDENGIEPKGWHKKLLDEEKKRKEGEDEL